MIPDRPIWLAFIRISILFLRSITPLCVVHCILYLIGLAPVIKAHGAAIPFHLVTIPETLFYLLVYLPKRHAFQRPSAEGTGLSRKERRELFDRCWKSVPDIGHFLKTWFRGAPLYAIKKENFKEMLAWAFLNKSSRYEEYDEELDEYVAATEKLLEKPFEEGRGPCQPLRPSVDPINIQHRPLSYYVCGIGLLDTVLFFRMWRLGFQHYALNRWWQSFPYRPLSGLAKHRSPARDLSYWYRPHTSKSRLPVLFVHGIGVGLVSYTDFLSDLIDKDTGTADNQVGILAIEIMAISFRVTSPALHSQEMARQVHQILQLHGWDKRKFVLSGNSYGTIIATHLIRSPDIAPSIASMVLIDPVNLWIHMGDVAFNFTVKKPVSASEHELHFFACTDIGSAHTVTRRFVWTENVLWKDELKERKAGIIVSGRDIILDGPRLKDYLLNDEPEIERSGINAVQGAELVRAGAMELLWFRNLNHAEVFECKKERRLLTEMVWRYCCER
ncbi:hypothetical protein OHC33_001257 [Knufia fluminis]|uniref:AB hydrolase-1 domain-containing protein n=1 Tax=Knufia fluminis TaxID=191047 RepID=A0AAN8I7D5_9EURO|nr:hypothetical protein OHC33_001257 [Knufia fluminis]